MEPDGQTDPVRVRSIHDNRMHATRTFYCWESVQQIRFCQLFCLFVIMKRFDLESF